MTRAQTQPNGVTNCAAGIAAPALRAYIERYVGFRARGIVPASHGAFPSRYVMLAISLGPPIAVTRMPNPFQAAACFSSCVSGLHDTPSTVAYGSYRDALYVSLKPAGTRALLGVENRELSGRFVDLRDIWGRDVEVLRQRLKDAATWPECFGILDEVFLAKIHRIEPPGEIAWAWERIQKTRGRIHVHTLAREVGWGRRHFAERFRTEVGVPPKTAARILRFEHACRLIKHEQPGLAHVAATCGFYDQAHMTREWKLLAGCTPRDWIRQELPFFQDFDDWAGDNAEL